MLSTWSSGTGAATFVGPLLYSAMVAAGFSPRKVLLSMIVVPVMMGVRSVTGGTGDVQSASQYSVKLLIKLLKCISI